MRRDIQNGRKKTDLTQNCKRSKKEYPRNRYQEGGREMDVVYPQMKIATLQECSYCIVE